MPRSQQNYAKAPTSSRGPDKISTVTLCSLIQFLFGIYPSLIIVVDTMHYTEYLFKLFQIQYPSRANRSMQHIPLFIGKSISKQQSYELQRSSCSSIWHHFIIQAKNYFLFEFFYLIYSFIYRNTNLKT